MRVCAGGVLVRGADTPVGPAPPQTADCDRPRADDRRAPHPEVRALLDELLAGARAILGDRLIGLYVRGSLAIGDFQPDRSDVDFVAVTDGEIVDDGVRGLAALHARLAAGPSRWGDELEGSYVSLEALRTPGLRAIRHPYIDRGTGTLAAIDNEGGYWEIQRWLLREHGIAVAGPPLREAIGAVGPERLRAAVVDILCAWWLPMLATPARLAASRFGYRCYAVLTMCRTLYTLRNGTIATKPVAARWAIATLGPRWTPLIERALARSPDAAPDLEETLALIRHTGDAADEWRRAGAGAGASA
jgi:aminoglycoside adenylyltransferase-like protein